MSDLERDYTLDVPEEANLQQALDIRLGPGRLTPGTILRNASIDDLRGALQAAWLHKAKVVVNGFESLSATALGVDLSNLQDIIEVDTVSSLCRVERCATPTAINETLSSENLWLESGHFSNPDSPIGPALESGEAAPLVASLTAALADGTHFSTPLAPRRATGPNPDNALIGWQGRLGIITHATLRVCVIPDWTQAVQIDGPTVSLIEATRKTLRTYKPAYAWLERTSRGKARLVIVPSISPIPLGEFSSFTIAPQLAKSIPPAPMSASPRRLGWPSPTTHQTGWRHLLLLCEAGWLRRQR